MDFSNRDLIPGITQLPCHDISVYSMINEANDNHAMALVPGKSAHYISLGYVYHGIFQMDDSRQAEDYLSDFNRQCRSTYINVDGVVYTVSNCAKFENDFTKYVTDNGWLLSKKTHVGFLLPIDDCLCLY